MIDPVSWYIEPLTYRSFLLMATLVLAIMTLVLLVVMIVHKTYVELREARSARIRTRYDAIIPAFLNEHRPLVAPRRPLTVDALADAAIGWIPRLETEAAHQLRDELVRLGVVESLVSRSRTSRSWVRRHRALERLGFLRLPGMRPMYLDLIAANHDVRVVCKALWALSYVAEVDDLPAVLRCLGDTHFMSAKFNEYLFTNIISEFRIRYGDDETVAILERLLKDEQLPVLLKRDIIEACGRIGFTSSAPLIIDTFHRLGSRPEIRITVLRAAGELASDDVCSVLVPSLGDEDWRVRVVSSHYAHLCPQQSIPKLEDLLRDRNYHVRINAAHTLARLGADGKAALNRALSGEDRFARDISRYLLGGN